MIPAQKIQSGIFRTEDLFRVHATWSHLEGVRGCPATVRPWVIFFAALIKIGCREIHAPIWAITKAAYESSAKNTCSASSTRRALAWLADHGYVTKRTLRIGKDAHGVILKLNLDRFSFFLRPRQTVSTFKASIPDRYDNIPHQSKRPGDEITNNINTKQIDPVVITKCIKSKTNAKKRNHPVLYTCFCVLQNDPSIWRVLGLARLELKNRGKSEIDFERYESQWGEMTIAEREYTARTEILPILRRKMAGASSMTHKPEKQNNNGTLDKIVKSIAQQSEITETAPPEYVYDPAYSKDENEALRSAQIKLFWQRKNLKIG